MDDSFCAPGDALMERSLPRTCVSWRTVPTFIAGAVATLAVAMFLSCHRSVRSGSEVADRAVRWWANVWLRATGARVIVHGLDNVNGTTGYVVVSNHESNLDPMVHLSALPISLRILTKHELFRIPVLGWLMRVVGMVEVDRRCADLKQINEVAAGCLASSHSLLVFPEGTTSTGQAVDRFKDGAFAIAVINQAPILPVTIHGSCRVWARGGTAIHAGVVHVIIGKPLATTGLTHCDVAILRNQARDIIESTHRDLVYGAAR
mgnify:CR=1 FL=1